MTIELEVQLLAACPQHVPELAKLWFNELGQQWIPNASVERAEQTYMTHLNHDTMPLTYVAVHKGHPIGMVSLRDNDGILEGVTPWLGSLIVNPDYRSQGIGEILIDITKQRAKAMGYNKLYLFALDKTIPDWYAKLGWKYKGMDALYHHPVTVMDIDL
jgi:GNAT superfamily N-acetyltransferase